MSFADLKKARASRQVNYTNTTKTKAESSKPTVVDEEPTRQRVDSKPYSAPDELYAQLGDSFEIRTSEIGRGLYVKESVQEAIKAGMLVTNSFIEGRNTNRTNFSRVRYSRSHSYSKRAIN